jgi:hypothetical protein
MLRLSSNHFVVLCWAKLGWKRRPNAPTKHTQTIRRGTPPRHHVFTYTQENIKAQGSTTTVHITPLRPAPMHTHSFGYTTAYNISTFIHPVSLNVAH